jgi:hypothetical protein
MLTAKEQKTTPPQSLKCWNSDNTLTKKEGLETTPTPTQQQEEQRDRQPGRRETYHLVKQAVSKMLTEPKARLPVGLKWSLEQQVSWTLMLTENCLKSWVMDWLFV